jgi:hypothetical protein
MTEIFEIHLSLDSPTQSYQKTQDHKPLSLEASGLHTYKTSTLPWATSSVHFYSGYFVDGASWSICLGWPWATILSFSPSQEARITGMSHWHPAPELNSFFQPPVHSWCPFFPLADQDYFQQAWRVRGDLRGPLTTKWSFCLRVML